jgi:hypothetical protein
MAKVVEPNAKEICEECKTHNVRTPAAKVIFVEVGDVEKRRIPLCQRHYDELRAAVKTMDDQLDKDPVASKDKDER